VTEAELDALADEIVARIQSGRKAVGGRRADAPTRSGRQEAVSRGALALALAPATQPAAVAITDISWRGPNVMKAAWSPAQGARRVADFVDHTLLKAEATRKEVVKLCAEARQHRFAAVCVNAGWVELCVKELEGTEVAVATVCGFPLGATTPRAKAAEAAEAVAGGAGEVDMVIALGRAKGGEWAYVEDDIRAVVEASRRAIVKVIIESSALTPEEIVKASAIAKESGAHFVKTSTGFHPSGGATTDAVRLMRLVVGDDLGVKASGGVRDCATALAMIAAGASRIGTSSGVGFVTCLGPGPLPLAELLKQPHAHGASCTSGTCAPAGGGQPY
jgi:deoxyribose-phosphate aldolase